MSSIIVFYLFSEIDSLTEIIEKNKTYDEDGDVSDIFHSLIIEVLGQNTGFYIEMVFNYVDILPKEPIAYELMLASDDFYVPIYREDEDVDKLPEWISKPAGTKYIPDEDDDS